MIYDVIVVGGGHAGCEAAYVAAKMGSRTLLVTSNINKIGELSCNPSIGGVGKSHLVKEIDVFDGLIGKAADTACICMQLLNHTKGPAVQSLRAQVDRKIYKKTVQNYLQNQDNLTLLEDEVVDIVISSEKGENVIEGVELCKKGKILSKSVVLSTGTFLGGIMFCGSQKKAGGRVGDIASNKLANSLRKYNFQISRLKTGTPPRLDGHTINWRKVKVLEHENSDEYFSSEYSCLVNYRTVCHTTETNEKVHRIIKDNLHLSSNTYHSLSSLNPRYCPSLEDKIVRFPDRMSHTIFLEPEGLTSKIIYPAGISMSLPENIQKHLINCIDGLENVNIIIPAYTVEYDFISPIDLYPTLETKKVKNLFFAGQINGTTGYEEAAAQGLLAGINATLQAKNENKVILNRNISYIGVMVDDLTLKGVTEPYRMFTSRSEYRLSLRCDNADRRLMHISKKIGCCGEAKIQNYNKKEEQILHAHMILKKLQVSPSYLRDKGVRVSQDGVHRSAFDLLSMPNVNFSTLEGIWDEVRDIPLYIRGAIKSDACYSSYQKKQKNELSLLSKSDNIEIPNDIDYKLIKGLSSEDVEKMSKIRPVKISHAMRIEGVTPSAVVQVLEYIRRLRV